MRWPLNALALISPSVRSVQLQAKIMVEFLGVGIVLVQVVEARLESIALRSLYSRHLHPLLDHPNFLVQLTFAGFVLLLLVFELTYVVARGFFYARLSLGGDRWRDRLAVGCRRECALLALRGVRPHERGCPRRWSDDRFGVEAGGDRRDRHRGLFFLLYEFSRWL